MAKHFVRSADTGAWTLAGADEAWTQDDSGSDDWTPPAVAVAMPEALASATAPAPQPASEHTVALTTESPTLDPPVGQSTLPTDPFFSQEWNLTNPTAGVNVETAWQNYTGAGVKVAIVDDGIDDNHPDLAPNYLFNLQYDTVTNDGSAYGNPSTDDHGTTVAGVLAGADNGVGMVGVAYNAGIAGIRIGYGANSSASQLATAFTVALTNGFDVVNDSWGYETPFADNFAYMPPSETAILDAVEYGRNGLGINIVFSAMNYRSSGDNVEYHNFQNDPYVITVAATDANGVVASFSDPGAAILVSAPGTSDITDDRLGSYGWSSGDYVTVAGTSYSAPTVSGIIALMLQANPNLGYRDAQEILAYSARLTDPTRSTWEYNGADTWNGGGLHYSNDYGFGLVDATAAVRLAESWNVQSTYADMSTESLSHTDNARYTGGGSVLTSRITFNTALTLDKTVIDLNLTDPNVNGLKVSLISPDGTSALLVSDPANGTGSGINFEMSADTFMGENAAGTWTLSIADSLSGDSGTLNGWTLTALGSAPAPAPDYIYTNDFAATPGAGRAVLNDSSGDAEINTAAVTAACTLNLNAGATCSIDGRSLQIGASTVVKSVWAGDGNDTITCNNYGDTVEAGRGNDTIIAGTGPDVLSGGPGNDTFVFDTLKAATTASGSTGMFSALAAAAVTSNLDTITDFTAGQDVIDLRGLFQSLGYAGTNPVADGWLQLVQSVAGTSFVIDPHNGQSAVTELTAQNVSASTLHQGTDFLTVSPQV